MPLKKLTKRHWFILLLLVSGASIVYLIYYGSSKKSIQPQTPGSSSITPADIPALANLPTTQEKYYLNRSSLTYLATGLYWFTPTPLITSASQLIEANQNKVLSALPVGSRPITVLNSKYVTFVNTNRLLGIDPADGKGTVLDDKYLSTNVYNSDFQVIAQVVAKSVVFPDAQKNIPFSDTPLQVLSSFDNSLMAVLLPKQILVFSTSSFAQVAAFPTSKNATNLAFTWSPRGNIFIIETLHQPREVSYVYKLDMKSKRKLFLSDTFPLPGGVSPKIIPAASPADDLLFADNQGGVWFLSTTLVGPSRSQDSHPDL